jgi:hypothetical protein
MKLRTLVITVAILAVLSGVVFLVNRPVVAPVADARVGQPLLKPADAEKIAKVRITDAGKTVELVKTAAGSWQVTSYNDFPADFDKLAHFVDDLTSAKIDSYVSSDPKTISRLEFKDTKVTFLDAGGATLLDLTLGKTDDNGYRFLHFGTEDKAFRLRLDTMLDTEAKNWADSALIKLKTEDIAKVELSFPAEAATVAAGAGAPAVTPGTEATTVTATRAKKDDPFTTDHVPAGQQFKPAALNTALSSLTDLRFTDTTATDDTKATAAKANARTVKLTTFDGRTVTIALGRKPEEQRPKPPAPAPVATPPVAGVADPGSVPAAGGTPALPGTTPAAPDATKPPDAATPDKSAAPEMETIPAGPVFAFIAHSDASAPINGLMQKRAFEVSDFALTSLPQKASELFEPLPPPPAAPVPPAMPATGAPTTTPPVSVTTPPVAAPAPAAAK